MLRAVFDYPSYKAYLLQVVESRGRGEKSRVAEASRCHLAYVHQVLNGPADFSFEQADLLNVYLGHSDEEADFFLLLLSLGRAGSESLRKRYRSRIATVLRERDVVANRLNLKKQLPAQFQATYYSAWYYSAVHSLLSIKEFQTKDQIAERLQLPASRVARILAFLTEAGLAKYRDGRYLTGQFTLHLPSDSPWGARHQSSWRMRSVRSLEIGDAEDFHYTSVVSLDPDDLPRIRKILVDAIAEVRGVVKPSLEKELVCYSLDCFKV